MKALSVLLLLFVIHPAQEIKQKEYTVAVISLGYRASYVYFNVNDIRIYPKPVINFYYIMIVYDDSLKQKRIEINYKSKNVAARTRPGDKILIYYNKYTPPDIENLRFTR